jgi:F420-non-reducing hydrogenase iron-sulfur subunit
MIGRQEVETNQVKPGVTVYVCANCARPARENTSAKRARPVVPDLRLPGRVQQVIIPCAGRLQPEHVLRAFENGSTVVSVVACQEDNCHHIEGSRRCSRRVDYLRSILNEIGLGEERLLLSCLPGSAMEDLALATGKSAGKGISGSMDAQVAAIRDQVVQALRTLPPNPLQQTVSAGRSGDMSGVNTVFGEDGIDE